MSATDWVEKYKTAWASNEPDDIRALFALDATYSGTPNDAKPARGHDEIVAWWTGAKDAPGDYTFEYWVVADNDDVSVVQNVTDYSPSGGKTYDNLWVIRWGADGLAEDFTEWAIARE